MIAKQTCNCCADITLIPVNTSSICKNETAGLNTVMFLNTIESTQKVHTPAKADYTMHQYVHT